MIPLMQLSQNARVGEDRLQEETQDDGSQSHIIDCRPYIRRRSTSEHFLRCEKEGAFLHTLTRGDTAAALIVRLTCKNLPTGRESHWGLR